MKQKIFLFAVCMSFAFGLQAQKYFSKTGTISFYSSTPIEDIEATSKSASTVFDVATGKIQWAVLIKSFQFEKALMQEHFNENYMESNKYPKATFSGTIINMSDIDLKKDGEFEAKVEGTLEIHGVKKDIKTTAKFKVSGGAVVGTSQLKVLVADYGIEIPGVVKDNIAKEIDIKIKADYELLDKT